MAKTLVQTLAEYAYNLKYESLSQEVINKAKTCILHGIGIGLATYDSDPVQVALRASKALYGAAAGDYQATILVNGSKVPLSRAIFVNAIMFHTRTQEDTHMAALTHFGPNVITTSLALSEALGRSGKDMIEAVVAGYQIGASVGAVSGKETTTRGFRASSLYGAFGGATAASKLLRLTETQTANAISFAANFAMGLNQTWLAGTMDYAIEVGQAAVNGLTAAMLAKEGGESADTVLEGKAGFYRAFAGFENVRSQVEEQLAKKYQLFDVTLKPYNVCACNQSPVTLVLDMLKKTPLKPEEIGKITINMNPVEANYPGVNCQGPFSRYGGTLMSTQYCVATALKYGGVSMAGMLEFDDPVIMDLVSKTTVIPTADKNPLCCTINIETKDGRKISDNLNITLDFYSYSFEQDTALLRGMLHEMRTTPEKFDKLVQNLSQLEKLEKVGSIIGLLVD